MNDPIRGITLEDLFRARDRREEVWVQDLDQLVTALGGLPPGVVQKTTPESAMVSHIYGVPIYVDARIAPGQVIIGTREDVMLQLALAEAALRPGHYLAGENPQ